METTSTPQPPTPVTPADVTVERYRLTDGILDVRPDGPHVRVMVDGEVVDGRQAVAQHFGGVVVGLFEDDPRNPVVVDTYAKGRGAAAAARKRRQFDEAHAAQRAARREPIAYLWVEAFDAPTAG